MKMISYKAHPEIDPSPAERLVMQHLDLVGVEYLREVVFNNTNFRYDFYLPEHKLIIEYDGKQFHSSKKAIYKDEMKNNFARNHGLRIIRLQGLEYIKFLFTPHHGRLLDKKVVTVEDVKNFVANENNFKDRKHFKKLPKKSKKQLHKLEDYAIRKEAKKVIEPKKKKVVFIPKDTSRRMVGGAYLR